MSPYESLFFGMEPVVTQDESLDRRIRSNLLRFVCPYRTKKAGR